MLKKLSVTRMNSLFIEHFIYLFILVTTPMAYENSQTRDQIQAIAVTYPAAAAMPNPLTHCTGPGIKSASWRCMSCVLVLQHTCGAVLHHSRNSCCETSGESIKHLLSGSRSSLGTYRQ